MIRSRSSAERAAQIVNRELARGGGRTKMRVVQDTAAPGKFEARNPAKFSDAHRHDVCRFVFPLEKIEEGLELCGRVGSGRHFNDVCA